MILTPNAMIVSWAAPDAAKGDGTRSFLDAWDPLIQHRWVRCRVEDPSWADRQLATMRDVQRGRTLLVHDGVLRARGVEKAAVGDRVRLRTLDRAGKPSGEQLTYVVADLIDGGAKGAAGAPDILRVMLAPWGGSS